jgi:hypothetical protein
LIVNGRDRVTEPEPELQQDAAPAQATQVCRRQTFKKNHVSKSFPLASMPIFKIVFPYMLGCTNEKYYFACKTF